MNGSGKSTAMNMLLPFLLEADTRRIALGNGLIAWRRSADARWKLHWLDFPSKAAPAANQPR